MKPGLVSLSLIFASRVVFFLTEYHVTASKQTQTKIPEKIALIVFFFTDTTYFLRPSSLMGDLLHDKRNPKTLAVEIKSIYAFLYLLIKNHKLRKPIQGLMIFDKQIKKMHGSGLFFVCTRAKTQFANC